MARKSVRSHVVCPKCKTAELEFVEVSEAYEKWTQDSEGVLDDTGEDGAILSPDVLRVEARCLDDECGHKWTVRGVDDVTQLPNWDNGEEDGQPETDEEETSGDEEEVAEAEEAEEEATEEEAEADEEDGDEDEGEVAEEPPPPPQKNTKPDKKNKKNKKDAKANKNKAGGKNKGKKAKAA